MFALEGYTTRLTFHWQTAPAPKMRAKVVADLFTGGNLSNPERTLRFDLVVSAEGVKVYNTSQGICYNKDFLRQVRMLANTYFRGLNHATLMQPQLTAYCALSHDPTEIPVWSDAPAIEITEILPNNPTAPTAHD